MGLHAAVGCLAFGFVFLLVLIFAAGRQSSAAGPVRAPVRDPVAACLVAFGLVALRVVTHSGRSVVVVEPNGLLAVTAILIASAGLGRCQPRSGDEHGGDECNSFHGTSSDLFQNRPTMASAPVPFRWARAESSERIFSGAGGPLGS